MNCDYFIYRYTWPDGHVYIGKSKKGRKRYGVLYTYKKCPLVYNYWKKHGDPKKEILEDNISEEFINEKECFYIKENNSFYENNKLGLNLTSGGDGGNIIGRFSQKRKEEIYKKQKETFLKNNNIDEYSKKIKDYYEEHPERKKKISETIKKYFNDNPDKKEEARIRLKKYQVSGEEWHKKMDKYIRRGEDCPSSRKCICIETQKIFVSCTEAAKEYGILYKVIHKCCKGLCNTAGGYHWAFIEDKEKIESLSEFIGKKRNLFRKKIICVETQEIFNTSADVSRKFNVSEYIIKTCCEKNKELNGFHFKFLE